MDQGVFALPVENPPGTHFVYNSGAIYMLSAIITADRGNADQFCPRLFEPLGIEGYNWISAPRGSTPAVGA